LLAIESIIVRLLLLCEPFARFEAAQLCPKELIRHAESIWEEDNKAREERAQAQDGAGSNTRQGSGSRDGRS
jgi:hypothetical protein